jgi:hypothetical protein
MVHVVGRAVAGKTEQVELAAASLAEILSAPVRQARGRLRGA